MLSDFLKIIGRPVDEIQMNPKWGFHIIEQEDGLLFGIETPNGTKCFPQYLAISAFLKVLKIRAELNLETVVKKVIIQTCFNLTDSQKSVFKNAAFKLGLEIGSFSVCEMVQ